MRSLSESQKNIPIAAGNKLPGRGAGLPEVRESHKMLTEFSALVEQLLAAPNPIGPSPVLNNSAAALPSPAFLPPPPKVPSSPPSPQHSLAAIQSVVDTAPAASAASAAPVAAAIAQTLLAPPPLACETIPGIASEAHAASQMLKQESATSVTTSSSASSTASITNQKAESPQASPPRTPGGSLLASPSDEEFDPRAPLKPALAKPAASQPEAPAPKNGKGKNKKGS